MSKSYLPNLLQGFPSMSLEDIRKQPRPVWLEVEREAMSFKGFTIKGLLHIPSAQRMQPGWLKEQDFEHLLALDVPITKLFTAVATRQQLTSGGTE